VRRIAFLAAAALALAACGHRDPKLTDFATHLEDATPPDQRVAVEADLELLQNLAREQKLGEAERQALLDLYASAARDGVIDDDERILLTRLTRDIVSGGGSVHAENASR
jgi:hypothetical protein